MTLTLPTERGSEYAGLSRQIRAARLLDRARWHYALRITATAVFFVACWWAAATVGNSWFVLVAAGVLGLASTQIAFLGHDGGHQQIAASRAGNTIVGLVAGLLTGLSTGWWADKHNRHHANPNKEDHDPDIGEGVLAFTTTHAAQRRGRIARMITANQAVLFFPLLTLEGLNLHVASARWLASTPGAKLRRTQMALLAVHLIGYVSGALLVLTPLHALAFMAVHQAVFGLYMGCSFAPNHKGMPIISAHEKLDYLRRQVLTSRNIRGGWFVDQLLGGLNYQIEHHLFPSMPRPHLRRAQRVVRDYCTQQQITYTETGLFSSYGIALRYLHSLGAPLRAK
ncbi:MAG TPA: acyl-CoA desaturase [Chloroflexota bacterium]|nr:acyl-CoA desaturase [Chloroflexota bacterium]